MKKKGFKILGMSLNIFGSHETITVDNPTEEMREVIVSDFEAGVKKDAEQHGGEFQGMSPEARQGLKDSIGLIQVERNEEKFPGKERVSVLVNTSKK